MNLLDSGQPWIPTGERSGLLTRIATTESMDFAALGFQRAQSRWRKAYPLLPHSPINAALCAAPPRQRLPVLMDARLPPGQSRRN